MKRKRSAEYFLTASIFATAVFLFRVSVATGEGKYDAFFDNALTRIAAFPEVKLGDKDRESFLKSLDPVLQENNIINDPSLGRFFKARMNAFAADFEKTRPAAGAAVWKLYNAGVVIRMPEATVAADVITGMGRSVMDSATLNSIANGSDILLITHEHIDHSDLRVVKKFTAAGKTVIAPPGLWRNVPQGKSITYLRDGSVTLKGVKITAFPSFQGDTPNNVYLIEPPGGLSFMITGDENEQGNTGKEWYMQFGTPLHVSALLPNSWCPNIKQLMQHVAPDYIIPLHEHELSHVPSQRTTYRNIYDDLSPFGIPLLVMAWGERVNIAASYAR